MATVTGPVCVLGVPAAELTPGNIDTALPGYGTTTATETAFDMYTSAASTNQRDPSGKPGAMLMAGGNPSSSLTLTTTTHVPGIPGQTARYRYSDGTYTKGADAPYRFLGLYWFGAVTAGNGNNDPTPMATPDGRAHMCWETRVGTSIVKYNHLDPSTEAVSTERSVATHPTLPSGFAASPVMWYVESDNAVGYVLYLAYWKPTDADTNLRLRIAHSKDSGATWSSVDTDLKVAFTGTNTWADNCVAYDPVGKQLTLMVINNVAGTITARQYVCNDPTGASWSPVAPGNISNVVAHDMTVSNGIVFYAYTTSAMTTMKVVRREATYVGWESATADTGYAYNNGYVALTADTNGWLWLLGRANADAEELVMQVSTNNADDWGDPTGDYPYNDATAAIVIDDDPAGTTLTDGVAIHSATWVGESLWIGSTLVSSGSVGNSAVMLRFGAVSNVTMASNTSGVEVPYYPTAVPATKSAAYAYTGGGAESITVDGALALIYRIAGSVGAQGYNTYTPTADHTVLGFEWCIGEECSGGANTSKVFAAEVAAHNNGDTDHCNVSLRINADTGAFRLYDDDASTVLGSGTFVAGRQTMFRVMVDADAQNVSAWYRQLGADEWISIASDAALTGAGGALGASGTVRFGKIGVSASVSQIDTLWFFPMGSDEDSWAMDVASDNYPTSLVGIRATTTPQRVPEGVHLWWQGAPLWDADQYTATVVSRTPLYRVSPLSASPSPTLQYVGATGSAGATYRIVWDFGSSYVSNFGDQMFHLSWFNAPQIANWKVQIGTGAAWFDVLDVDNEYRPFGADGAVTFARNSASSVHFTPGAPGTFSRVFKADELAGWWVRISDGTDTIAATIKRNSPGQWASTGSAQAMSFEIDPDTIVVEAGSFANLATSTSTGNIVLHYPDGGALSSTVQEATRYWAVEFTMEAGATVPKIGTLSVGPAYLLARPYRDGASVRWTSPDELRVIEGTGLASGRRVRRRNARTVELPYDQILWQPGMIDGAQAVNPLSFDGSVNRAYADNNIDVILGARTSAGRRFPVTLFLDVDIGSTDVSSANYINGGEQILLGYLDSSFDRVASRGFLRGANQAHQSGGRLVIEELI